MQDELTIVHQSKAAVTSGDSYKHTVKGLSCPYEGRGGFKINTHMSRRRHLKLWIPPKATRFRKASLACNQPAQAFLKPFLAGRRLFRLRGETLKIIRQHEYRYWSERCRSCRDGSRTESVVSLLMHTNTNSRSLTMGHYFPSFPYDIRPNSSRTPYSWSTMELLTLTAASSLTLPVSIAACVVLISLILHVFSKPAFPANAPELTKDAIPLIGSRNFFTKRWDFYKSAIARSKTGNFAFYAGKWPVVGISGHDARKLFFESRQLNLQEGYAALMSGAPDVKEDILADPRKNDPGALDVDTE